LITRSCSNLKHPVCRFKLKRLGHKRNNVGLGNGLPFSYRERIVIVGNLPEIFADKETLRKQVMSIVTDSTPVEEPKDPNKCNLFAIAGLFLSPQEKETLAGEYRQGGLKYVNVKKDLVERIWDYFAPYRAKREDLVEDRDRLQQIMKMGADKAREVASRMIDEVRSKTGLHYGRGNV